MGGERACSDSSAPTEKASYGSLCIGWKASGPQIDMWLQALTYSSPTKAKLVREPVPGESDERWGDSGHPALPVRVHACLRAPPTTYRDFKNNFSPLSGLSST